MDTTIILLGGSVTLTLAMLVTTGLTLTRLYKVPRSNEAIVRTGGAKPQVAVGAGMFVLPVVHDSTRISLEAVSVSIDRKGNEALRTEDKFLAEVEGTMLVQVDSSDPSMVLLAAQSLGEGSAGSIENLVLEKTKAIVTDAMRSATMKKTFLSLNLEKEQFGKEVHNSVADDLKKLGLKLISVTITEVRQKAFDPDDNSVFTAEGRRNAAQIVEKNREETNRITRAAEIAVYEQNVEAREQELALSLRKKQKEDEQARAIEEYEAQQKALARKNVLAQLQEMRFAEAEQARAVRERQITEQQRIEEAEITKAKEVALRQAAADTEKAEADASLKVAEESARRLEEEAEIARRKAIEAANIAKEREVHQAIIDKDRQLKVAEEQRQQAIETAEVERQKAVAAVRAEEAEARATQARAEATQRAAEEQIVTVRAEAEAERQRKIVTIKAEEEAAKDRIEADKLAYMEAKQAEGERDAAEKRAQAARLEAEGRAAAREADAEGEAKAVRLSARAYADELAVRAEAEFEAAAKQAEARAKLAAAELEEGRARAEARRLQVEAENAVARELLFRDVAIKALEVAPLVVHEVMAPVANVAHDVKILQVNGLGSGEVEGLPATILNTGLAAAGVLPFLKEGTSALAENPDVKAIAKQLTGLASAGVSGLAKALDDETPALEDKKTA